MGEVSQTESPNKIDESELSPSKQGSPSKLNSSDQISSYGDSDEYGSEFDSYYSDSEDSEDKFVKKKPIIRSKERKNANADLPPEQKPPKL